MTVTALQRQNVPDTRVALPGQHLLISRFNGGWPVVMPYHQPRFADGADSRDELKP